MPVLLIAADPLTVAVIRVEFQLDDSPATTGNGSFISEDTVDIECSEWTLDPPPHNKGYFQDHIIAADNYWQRVSNGQVSIDLANSAVFPATDDAAYQLPNEMLYYHPYLEVFDETEKLLELTQDAIAAADATIDFNNYNTIIIAHAGMGGDFAFALDPTPGNIPSAYLTPADFQGYGTIQADGKTLDNVIIIPESQNFLQYAETRSLFEDTSDPCFYQVGLNGTLALMLGFHLGLPPMFNTETGRSLVGGFALMDQGSNNFHGVVPAFPNPYTRIQHGWTTSNTRSVGDSVSLNVGDNPIQIQISENEYYLIENRQRNLLNPDSMMVWIDSLGFDTVSVKLSERGVVLQVDEQHAGLPGNGLNIWYVDETAWFTDENPNGGRVQLVDFIEADGAQDMGHATQLLFADYLETGWWFDPWFAGNAGWFHMNRTQAVIGDSLLSFSSSTFPATVSNIGNPTHLRIEHISRNGLNMSFSISSDRLVNVDSVSSFIGWDETGESLWAFNSDSTQILQCSLTKDQLSYVSNSFLEPDSIFSGNVSGNFEYRNDWIAPYQEAGIKLFHISSGNVLNIPELDSLFEFSGYGFFAKMGNEYVTFNWMTGLPDILPAYPVANFPSGSGFQVILGSSIDPSPAGVHHVDPLLFNNETIAVSWSAADAALKITYLESGSESLIEAEKPLHIIPMDTDDDGSFEIALFYTNMVKIVNQTGTPWNGNPFTVDSYYGNPIIGPIHNGELGIFLRHADHYTIYSFNGEIIDQGVLPSVTSLIRNSLRVGDNTIYILSDTELLYFEYETLESGLFWIDPQGSARGDRVAYLTGSPVTGSPAVKKGSTYNYPNPIKGAKTTIRAWLGEVDEWSIEIFSLNGAQIEYIELDVNQQNSYNEWIWDASGVSNGVYLAQIVAGDNSEIIKIAVIR